MLGEGISFKIAIVTFTQISEHSIWRKGFLLLCRDRAVVGNGEPESSKIRSQKGDRGFLLGSIFVSLSSFELPLLDPSVTQSGGGDKGGTG